MLYTVLDVLGPGSEYLKAHGEAVSIGVVLRSRRQADDLLVELLHRLKHRPILLLQQSCGHMHSEVGVNPDQVCIEGGMMNFRQRNAIGNYGLAKSLVFVGDDVRRIEK